MKKILMTLAAITKLAFMLFLSQNRLLISFSLKETAGIHRERRHERVS